MKNKTLSNMKNEKKSVPNFAKKRGWGASGGRGSETLEEGKEKKTRVKVKIQRWNYGRAQG